MAPPNLQGLNIVHPPQPQNQYLSDHDLLAVPPFADLNLSAQLDLWTNLNFQSDEPLITSRDEQGKIHRFLDDRRGSRGDNDADAYNAPDDDLQEIGKVAEAHSHENVVTGTLISSPTISNADGKNGRTSAPSPVSNAAFNFSTQPPLDIHTLLASFGIDAFQPPNLLQPSPANPAATASIAQLLSYHAAAAALRPPVNPLPSVGPVPSTSQLQSQSQPQKSTPSALSVVPPAPKRARTAARNATPSEPQSPTESLTPVDEDDIPSSTPLTAAEDKRRRNTAASARFRLKKKEREAALEKKAKELEVKVSELEKECEALRRENGWLKGLVVGVTGGAVQPQPQSQPSVKRVREEDTGGSQA